MMGIGWILYLVTPEGKSNLLFWGRGIYSYLKPHWLFNTFLWATDYSYLGH